METLSWPGAVALVSLAISWAVILIAFFISLRGTEAKATEPLDGVCPGIPPHGPECERNKKLRDLLIDRHTGGSKSQGMSPFPEFAKLSVPWALVGGRVTVKAPSAKSALRKKKKK
jgi:hypothetical protein